MKQLNELEVRINAIVNLYERFKRASNKNRKVIYLNYLHSECDLLQEAVDEYLCEGE